MSEKTFKPTRDLTFDTVQVNSQRLLKLLRETKTSSLRLDLNDVLQCDSAGLAFLIEAKRVCKHYNKALVLVGMSKMIYSLAEFCGVESMLVVQDDQ